MLGQEGEEGVEEDKEVTFGSLFAGIGGFDLGFEEAGMECKWQVEIDPACRQVLRCNWPRTAIHEDVKGVGKHNLEPVDVICGGFPCQDVSVAGRRAGMADGTRSNLFYEACRVVDELKPRWLVIENVVGLLSSRKGRDFYGVLSTLDGLGYGLAWRVLDSQYYGVAQRRRRVFIVGYLGGPCPPEILFEPESLCWDSAPRREKGKATPTIPSRRSASGGLGTDFDCDGGLVAHTLRGDGFDASEDGTGRGTPLVVAHALNARNGRHEPHAETFVVSEPITNRSYSDRGPDGNLVYAWTQNSRSEVRSLGDRTGAISAEPGAQQQTYASTPSGVRRLTPTECARLQGFDDDHNYWLSDSARYKQFGNAVTVNVAKWIGSRIFALRSLHPMS